jgi:ribosomal protein S18 acetylase RimI-like enzyme
MATLFFWLELLKQQNFGKLLHLSLLFKNTAQLSFLAFHPGFQKLGLQTILLDASGPFKSLFNSLSNVWIH